MNSAEASRVRWSESQGMTFRASLLLLALASPWLAAAASAGPAPAPSPGATFLIVNPSGRGNQGMAEGFLADFASALQAGWPKDAAPLPFTGRYHVTEADALASIKRDKPAFALVSAGFYLAHRDDLKLVPALQPVRDHAAQGVVHLVVKSGAPKKPPATMRLGGQLAGEPAWAAGPVLGLPAGSRPTFVPIAKTLEAVRQLQSGAIDGVLLADADWSLLKSTGKAAGLETAFTSATLPEGPVVTLGEPTPAARAALAALGTFASTDAGRKVLARMTIEGFVPAAAADYAPLAPAFDRARADLQKP